MTYLIRYNCFSPVLEYSRDVLSPLLFSVTLDYVMSKVSRESEGIRWGILGKLTDLDYADDMCLLTHST